MRQWFQFETKNDVQLMRIFLPGAQAVFSTRHGGCSVPPFDTMNLAFHVGDKPGDVADNRKRFTAAADIPLDSVVCACQVHGTNIEVVDSLDRGRGVYSQENALPETDAMITAEKNVVPAAFFADCVPVYLVDPIEGVIALAHAGWKGTVSGIAGKTVARMAQACGCTPSNCYAFIGPSIGPCCYSVGEEVLSLFNSNRGQFSSPLTKLQDRWMLDLWEANRQDLLAAGLSNNKIRIAGICTRCDSRFFSYRREGGITGRMGAFISLS